MCSVLWEIKSKVKLIENNHLLRGQKDYKLHALNNSYINIDNDQTEVVGNDESITIGNNRTESVGNDETISIGHDQSNTIGNDQSNHIIRNQVNKIDKDKITKIGNHRVDDVFADQEVTIGGHFSQTTNGEHELKAGTHIKSATKVHTLSGSDKLVIKGNGGTITLDSSGITLKGLVQIKGSLAVLGGGADGVEVFNVRANKGEEICWECLESLIEETN